MSKTSVTKFITSHFVDSNADSYFTRDGFQHLRTYLGNVWKGQPKVYTAPFAKGQSMAQVMSDWREILVSVQTEWPSLLNFEDDLASKVGPMSVQLPLMDRMPDIAHYYEDILLSSKPISARAIEAVKDEFRAIRGLRPRSQKNTVAMMKLSSNSGNPFFTKRRNVVLDTIPADPWAVRATAYWHSDVVLGQRTWDGYACAIVGWRGQEGGPSEDDVKQRVVWMFPFGVNVAELSVYQPLIEACQKHRLVPAWVSMDCVDREVTDLFDTKGNDDLIVCTDFSKFDQHFNSDMQDAAEDILEYLLTTGKPSEDWLRNVFPIKYMIPLCWEAVGPSTIHSKDGKRTMHVDAKVSCLHGEHGMASGSGGTNADETLAHRALQHEVAINNHAILNPHSMCLGDDGILSYPGITVDAVVNAYSAHGQECNPDKQYASTQDCVYLRRWHHKDYRVDGICVGVYSTMRALGRLRYLERFMDPEYWSPELVALRQLSIIENCKWHPLFHEFIDFCMKRDKYRLGIDIPGFLDNIKVLAKDAIDHMQDFLGYTKTLQGEGVSGIGEWEVVKYLKSKG